MTAKKLSSMINAIRESKLPDWHTLGTAGSFFKNPIISTRAFEQLKQQYSNLVSFNIP
ncbi:TPA: hypothetical protein DEP21_01855 [Patescibacteria group bacterium]|nr:hypothetical protein [Candidatus Gracilibacteria bacterium]